MNRSKIKIIIFVDYENVLTRIYTDKVEEISKKYKISEKKIFDVMYKKYFNLAASRKMTQKQAWIETVKELHLPMDWKELRDIHYELMQLNPPAIKLAQQLRKDYITVMLSKNTRSQFTYVKKKLKLEKYFDYVINTFELNLTKASRKTCLYLMKKFNCSANQIIYSDDQKINLNEPKKVGFKTIYYKNFLQFKKELYKHLNF